MFTESAELYDQIYSFKDYETESRAIASEILSRRPDCRTILDVGCGTGEHHRYLAGQFQIDGLDLDASLIDLARSKNQAGEYYVADMADFSLGRKYDAVICLFSSIAYVKTPASLAAATACFREHLNSGGIAMVEPWMTPDNWHDGRLHSLNVNRDDLKVCRMNVSASDGRVSILDFHYLIGTPDSGVRYLTERHELGLFTVDEMKNAFEQNGFDVTYDPEGLTGRGMYFGIASCETF